MTRYKAEWSRFDRNLIEARAAFADFSPADIEEMVDEAVAAARRSVRKASGPQHNDGSD